ncbi:MAG: AMIN domain-containing protein [candidate division Zixibacteria bacterium]|nr:AMIN domain-containing protein [candidate division Zixibacteria bacterium]
MRSFLTILCAATLLTATPAYASKVKSIELDKANGFTVAKINVKGKVRFTHQTEIAKDGKPFRIIVDILSATHDLSAKTYEQLPDCRITSIRTSQYAVKPEKIVRIVLDMKGESTYRIESQNNSVFLFVHDKESKPFASWSSDSYKETAPAKKPAVAKKPLSVKEEPDNSSFAKIASINKALDDDRKSSLEAAESKPFVYPRKEPSSAKKTGSEVSVPKVKKPSTTKKMYTPVINDTPPVDSDSKINPKPKAKTSTPKLATANKKSVTKKIATKPSSPSKTAGNSVLSTKTKLIKTAKVIKKPSTSVSKPTQAKQIKSKDKSKSATESKLKKTGLPASPNKIKSGKLAKSSSSKSTKKAALAKNSNAKKSSANKKKSSKPTTVAKTDKKAKKSSTARFRRSPAQSRKIKGTMVAEFPKRLVIKYKGKRYRDPFETLINETRISNSLVEKRVPNVEGLKLVGVLETAGESNRALFEDKDGFGYILSAGDKVQKGYVLRVDMEKVYFQIFEYGWSRTVALNMDSY